MSGHMKDWMCQQCSVHGTPSKPVKACSKCKHAHYCSVECQQAHWPEHKVLCKVNCDLKKTLAERAAAGLDVGKEQAVRRAGRESAVFERAGAQVSREGQADHARGVRAHPV